MTPVNRPPTMARDPLAMGTGMALAVMILAGCAVMSPQDTLVHNGRLATCPDRPNCVNSQIGDPRHRIDPIAYSGDPSDAMRVLDGVVREMPGSRIVRRTDRVLHVEYRTRWLGFIDDVVFFLPEEPLIHVRSASRKGYYDFGVNRKRVERIRALFQARLGGRSDQ